MGEKEEERRRGDDCSGETRGKTEEEAEAEEDKEEEGEGEGKAEQAANVGVDAMEAAD